MQNILLYHITDYQNLDSILKNKALSAHSQVINSQISYSDIANNDIQNRRSNTTVDHGFPNTMFHDYVPFYFAPKSPMLYSIKQGNISTYCGQQSDIIYFVTCTDKVEDFNKKFVFTDGHAIMRFTEFYNDLSHLNKIDWEVIEGKYWFDTDEYPDRKRKRQAEFLIHTKVELDLFLGIAVYNQKMKTIVEDILLDNAINIPVAIRPGFYY